VLVYKVLDLAPRDRAAPMGEVIMPSFTFLAAPAAPVWNNLRPVFVDVDPRTTNVVPEAVAAAITPRTVAISACHNFGNPCDIPALEAIAAKHGLPLVIDAAHGFGASLHGKPVGKGGKAQVFSLSPTKLLVAGEGGIVATDCDRLAQDVRIGREYGNDGSYDAVFSGVNGRMPELSAATALASLDLLDEVASRRREIAAAYRRGLAGFAGIGCMEETPGSEPSYKDFSITIDPDIFGCSRDRVRGALAARGIETRTYYDPPCHRQRAFDLHPLDDGRDLRGRHGRAVGPGEEDADAADEGIELVGLRRVRGHHPVDADAAAGVEWLQRAAANGSAQAQRDLALCLQRGTGIAKDEVAARPWLARAAASGDPAAQATVAGLSAQAAAPVRD
jgi:dTDP-4-amino-4,6-dideoxygalactose transaminase